MVLRLWHALGGYLRIRIAGPVPERLVNLCATHGIPVWDLRPCEDGLEASVPVTAVRALLLLRRRAGVRVRIAARRGLPFALRRLRPLRLALALLAVAVAGIYLLAQFVWFFEVRGTDRLDPARVLQVAHELGLRPGVPRAAVDPHRLARDLVLRLPELSWANLRFFGAKAVIEVAEKVPLPPSDLNEPGDVIARRPGVIERVVAIRGEPAVAPGQTVEPGQVLIHGYELAFLPQPAEEGATPGRQPVRARGRVLARTWYAAYAETPRVERLATPTGRSARRLVLRAGGRTVHLLGPARPPFARFEQEEQVLSIFRWRDAGVDVEFVRIHYRELAVHERQLDRDQAARRAEVRLRDHLLAQLPPGARIVNVEREVVLDTPDVVGVRMVVESIEDIGVFRSVSGRPGEADPRPLPGP